ncbi:MAG: TIM44-like domain-containing protein [Lentisphaeria bacterium]|nr:TIM44-like domain-containing protein [Lentisphaeria bacterium]
MTTKRYHGLMSLVHRCFRYRLWLVGALVVFAACDAFGRAGGGGRYGGGGGGGGGGFSGGGSSGDGEGLFILIYFLIRLIIEAPVIGIPVAIIVVTAVFFTVMKGGKSAVSHHQSGVIRSSHLRQDTDRVSAGVAAIRKRDSGFDPDVLGERIKRAFEVVQSAWCDQQLDPIRPFVTDGVFERFSLQVDELKARGLVNQMEGLTIHSVVLADAHSDEMFDTVSFRITASAVDNEVDVASGKRVSGGRTNEAFTEYWSFIRRPGVQSLAGDGLMEGNCPNCGSGLTLNASAKCPSCGALIKSGQYDWVLAEITQACEWTPVGTDRVPGFQAIRKTDPAFSIQRLEDRASVVFWRLMTSYREGRIDPVRKMAMEAFCQELAPLLRRDEQGLRTYPGHCAVGAVTTRAVVAGEPLDKAAVEIRWSSHQTQEDESGKTRQTKQVTLRAEVFVLGRRHGVAGKGDFALASAHCPGCGAAVSSSAHDACDYCGAVLNDPGTDWMLMERLPVYSERAQELIRGAVRTARDKGRPLTAAGTAVPGGTPASALEQAAWMIKMMVADGYVDDQEREQLEHFARHRGLTTGHIDTLIQSAVAGELDAPAPRDLAETTRWLEAMAEVALADGKIDPREKAALQSLGKHVGYSAYDMNQVIVKTRARLYREAKQTGAV